MFFSSTNIIITQYLGICIYILKLSQQGTCFAIFRLALIGSCTTYHYSAGVTNDSWNLQWNRDLSGWGGSISCQLGAPLFFLVVCNQKFGPTWEKKCCLGFFSVPKTFAAGSWDLNFDTLMLPTWKSLENRSRNKLIVVLSRFTITWCP